MRDVFREQRCLDDAMDRLVDMDPALARIRTRCGDIALRQRPRGLEGLLQIILAQQVSVASAQAIWEAFFTRFPDLDAERLSAASIEELQGCKLSRPKIRTIKALADAVANGLDFAGLEDKPTADVRSALVALHGIGPWTADIYLLFCLGRKEVFPAGDLALQIAVAKGIELTERPNATALAEIVDQRWSPEGGAAAHLFWAFYRQLKSGKDGIL